MKANRLLVTKMRILLFSQMGVCRRFYDVGTSLLSSERNKVVWEQYAEDIIVEPSVIALFAPVVLWLRQRGTATEVPCCFWQEPSGH